MSGVPVVAQSGKLECVRLTAEWTQPLLTFLRAIESADETGFFHPHAFTAEAVEGVVRAARKDLYYVLVEGGEVLGYGMLRGWDEGYEIPSLGIAIHPRMRGAGLGKMLMEFLHTAARQRGAKTMRLRVRSDNSRAKQLYESLGYKFQPDNGDYLLGFLDLTRGGGN